MKVESMETEEPGAMVDAPNSRHMRLYDLMTEDRSSFKKWNTACTFEKKTYAIRIEPVYGHESPPEIQLWVSDGRRKLIDGLMFFADFAGNFTLPNSLYIDSVAFDISAHTATFVMNQTLPGTTPPAVSRTYSFVELPHVNRERLVEDSGYVNSPRL
jgi:hypothetical protein